MKAISVSHDTISIQGKAYPRIRLFADSAIGRDVMPLFIPDIQVQWCSRVCLAARILRLGKNISEKFASRYVDALSMVNVLYPDPLDPQGEALIASGGYAILDGAVTTGRWVDCDLQSLESVMAEVKGATYDFTEAVRSIPRLVSFVSRLATVKTGDIIILESTAVEVPLLTNTYIESKLCGADCLKIKVK